MSKKFVILIKPKLLPSGELWATAGPQILISIVWAGTTGVRSPAEAKDFSSSLCIQTSSEAYPASCPLGTRSPFPGVKGGPVWRWPLTASGTEVKNE
jgi:hypothetical protein